MSVPTTVPKTVHQSMSDGLAAYGTRVAFGLMGEDTANLISDFDRAGLRYYAAFHENAAVSMAGGYAWASGEIGVAIISRGPGITNAMSALAAAGRQRRRMLVITGETALRSGRGVDSKAHVPQAALAAAAGLEYHTAADPGEVLDALGAATASAAAGRPALLAIPVDLLDQPMPEESRLPELSVPVLPETGDRRPAPSDVDLEAVIRLLANSRRPLILAGRGAVRAGARDQLIALAERVGGLLGTSLMARDLFVGEPLDFGLVGGCTSPRGRALLADIDCVLAFGASLNVFTTAAGSLFEGIPIVQFDVDPSSAGRTFVPLERSITADARSAAEALVKALGPSVDDEHPLHDPRVLGQLARLQDLDGRGDGTNAAIDPRVLIGSLDGLLSKDRMVVSDGGHMSGFPMMHLHVPDPDRYLLTPMGIAAIGLGLGAALGVAIAQPQRQTAFFVGDGSLAMTLGDLATVARYPLPLVIVVLNDQSYAAERHFLDLHSKQHDLSLHQDIDFSAAANALGIESATIRTVEDLRAQASKLSEIRQQPLLLDCKITATRSSWIEEIA